jgi:hypothetical protein
VTVSADATIALPILVSAMASTSHELLERRRRPEFTLESRLMTIDGQPASRERFEAVNESAV